METNTMAFVGSPELVTAMAIAGDLGFNPLTDTLINEDGEEVMLDATGDELPKMDLMLKTKVFKSQLLTVSVEVTVSETSDRLQLLAPFAPWDGKITGAKLLIKAFGNVLLITFLWLDHGCVSADI
jgi:aconitate hydratase